MLLHDIFVTDNNKFNRSLILLYGSLQGTHLS